MTFSVRTAREYARTEGTGSSHVQLEARCPRCGQNGSVHYVGSDVLEGSLVEHDAVHTEVNDHFACDACRSTWFEHRLI